MKQPDGSKIDKLFSDGLNRTDAPIDFSAKDWTAMEKMLDAGSKRGIIYNWRFYASGIAALLLLAMGLFLITKDGKTPANKVAKHYKAPKKHYGQTVPQSKVSDPTLYSSTGSSKPTANHPAEPSNIYAHWPAKQSVPFVPANPSPDTANQAQKANADQVLLALGTQAPMADTTGNAQTVAATIADTAAVTVIAANQSVKKQLKATVKSAPAFTLSLLGAPDLNGVNSFSNSQVGTNLGIQLTLQLTGKLSISTGAVYAVKPYQAANGQYDFSFVPAAPPTQVYANCKVLDIPLNVNYQFYTKGKNSVAIGTGLSSYFMLKENYRFDYEKSSYLQPYNLTVTEQNQHLFGVLNLNATYQRKINAKFSALVQPYIKLPLTGIGNGNVNLKSTGVALGFSWNINPFGKPK